MSARPRPDTLPVPAPGAGARGPEPALPASPHGAPRFANDWIGATLRLCPERRMARIAAGTLEWLLTAADFDALAAAAEGPGPLAVEWNPDLGQVLVPGGHLRGGASFFRLRS
ncbi:hypothetical protein NCCP1664_28390 [Zafaria cholistanensis]|uniref:Uncharacterized protein n=1 Tax=Zafaria cholistanensis TaxID=1682741 RepID=A0A5A7NU01_9MICC|nr:hypothetical protein [Zafaria cholistanensis]GER24344.1 hypothetical protein NCCP1664_28390 [Zafaria cholistanensis]